MSHPPRISLVRSSLTSVKYNERAHNERQIYCASQNVPLSRIMTDSTSPFRRSRTVFASSETSSFPGHKFTADCSCPTWLSLRKISVFRRDPYLPMIPSVCIFAVAKSEGEEGGGGRVGFYPERNVGWEKRLWGYYIIVTAVFLSLTPQLFSLSYRAKGFRLWTQFFRVESLATCGLFRWCVTLKI